MKKLQLIIAAIFTCSLQAAIAEIKKPNVIIILTDDQGYGDLSCHGNPILRTPHLDKLHSDSVRFTDFHVSPFCTPTRASLMTGHHAGRSGAFRTTGGRSMMYLDEITIADVFADAGYVTGMAGKWHLGDNAPHRPQDRGFQDVVWHRCGGIGQGSDYWGNTYFDDIYERVTPGSRVGKFEKFKGYCTDVFFREGIRFIEENKEKPFFYYLSLNAPHGPYRVHKEWAKPYQRTDVSNPNFYGMIANIDHNIGILRKRLDELKLTNNTILIFMTDNGTSAGAKFKGLEGPIIEGSGYNAGMRGKKSSIYEGGHRVPFFTYWPKGNLTGGKDIETLTAHIDVLPTLADLCGVELPADYKSDGLSLKPLLNDPKAEWPRDHLIMQYHGGAYGRNPLDKPFADTVVLTERWRLTNSTSMALHDITTDLAQSKNVIAEHPKVVAKLKALYEPFWKSVSPRIKSPAKIDLGNPDHNPTELCSQDWFMNDKGYPPYAFSMIRKLPRVTAPWLVNVRQAGRYRITLRQWPIAAGKPVVAVRAKVQISGQEKESTVKPGSKGVVFEVDLPTGSSELWTYLYDEAGKAGGAYFTEVEWLGEAGAAKPASKSSKVMKPNKATGKDLGAIWFIGDSITQSNADGDTKGSPRKSLYDLLKTNGYTFSYTGHHNKNVDGLPVTGSSASDNLYHYHSGVSGILIGDKKRHGFSSIISSSWKQGRLATVKPDIILIMLGTNDVGHGYELEKGPERLHALLDQIYALPNVGKPKVFLASVPPNRRNDADRANVVIFNEAVPKIVAEYQDKGREIHFVDQFKPIDDAYKANMRDDNLHPNGTGNDTISKQWFDAVQSTIGSAASSVEEEDAKAFPGKKSDFRGYDRYDIKTEKGRFSVTCPKKSAPGKPWLWRSLFWEAIKPFSNADLKLVEQGYHVVLAHGDVHGHPKGNTNIDAAYEYFTTKHGFAKKCSMASMSRGTLSLFTWASENPEKVNSIYVDNGVCNVDSWPGGKLVVGSGSVGSGAANSWADMKKVYGFTNDQELLDAKVSPIDKLEPLAKAGVPILMVCGSKDAAVPYEENDAIMEKRYKKLGGSIKVIIENKGHTHGMSDPSPILEFIKKHNHK